MELPPLITAMCGAVKDSSAIGTSSYLTAQYTSLGASVIDSHLSGVQYGHCALAATATAAASNAPHRGIWRHFRLPWLAAAAAATTTVDAVRAPTNSLLLLLLPADASYWRVRDGAAGIC